MIGIYRQKNYFQKDCSFVSIVSQTPSFEIMQKLSLGAQHDFIANTKIFPERLAGMILLDVELNGEAYYIYPKDLKKYYLGRPADAFFIMQSLGLGITNQDLAYIPIGNLDKKVEDISIGKILIPNVPFVSQAPFGEWSDQRQQDGCEEVSSLMAIKWAREESITKEEALDEILGSSEYTQKNMANIEIFLRKIRLIGL